MVTVNNSQLGGLKKGVRRGPLTGPKCGIFAVSYEVRTKFVPKAKAEPETL